MSINDLNILINKDIPALQSEEHVKWRDSFDVDINTPNWRHYEMVGAIGGIIAFEDHDTVMVKFFEGDDDNYWANDLNLMLDAAWLRQYKEALERMYDWLNNNCERDEFGCYTKLNKPIMIEKNNVEKFSVILKEYNIHGKQIGHVKVCSDTEDLNDKRIWLIDLYVKELSRNNGVGTKLMKRAIDTCKKLSIDKLYFWCKLELIPFYKKFGAKQENETVLSYELMSINIDTL